MPNAHSWAQGPLVEKYRQRVPRYTSYPPATSFEPVKPDTVDATYRRARQAPDGAPLSLYVHLPFCESMCRYCGCAAIVSKSGSRWSPYMNHLVRELEMTSEALGGTRRLTQMHWGGGTPSWLPEDAAAEFFERVVACFPAAGDPEFAIEIEPKTLRRGQLAGIRKLGFNRVSFGVQDLDPTVQASVAREFSAEEAAAVVSEARGLGFRSINVDLMYGLPRQTVETVRRTMTTVMEWRPDRIALFGYAHVPWMRPHQRLLPEEKLPDARARVELFAAAAAILEDAGYEHLGLDHFVLPDDDLAGARESGQLCRNFQGYSIRRADDLLGLGMSAIGQIAGTFLANQRKLAPYGDAIGRGEFPTERAYRPSPEQVAIARSIDELMCYGRLELDRFSAEFGGRESLYGGDLDARLGTLVEDGVVRRTDGAIEVTRIGRYVIRHVAAALDPMLTASDATAKRFSSGL